MRFIGELLSEYGRRILISAGVAGIVLCICMSEAMGEASMSDHTFDGIRLLTGIAFLGMFVFTGTRYGRL